MDRFTGTWRLVSVEDRDDEGRLTYPYGERPSGLLVYDASGHMAVQIMSNERAPEEMRSILEGFTAFFGTYEVNEEECTITHRVEGHLLPSSVGKELVRGFEFSGDRLILSPTGTRRVVWERVK
jgi:hypothetical protein